MTGKLRPTSRTTADADAIVIGSGPNGLVAANQLVDAGWSVLVLEAQPSPGGAVRSAELTIPGFTHDCASARFPLAAASPVMRALGLEEHGLRWRHAPIALAHPTPDERCAVLSTDLDATARSLETYAAGDGDRWRALAASWRAAGSDVVAAVLGTDPPIRAGIGLVRSLGVRAAVATARLGFGSVSSLVTRQFHGQGAALLLTANAAHTDLALGAPSSALFAWMLTGLGQTVGFPLPEGGAGQLTAALVARLDSRGGTVACGQSVTRIDVGRDRAVGVTTAGGSSYRARRAVIAAVSAPSLYEDLLAHHPLPARVRWGMRRFRWGHATVKVDWALGHPIPWSAPAARQAGTIHLIDSTAALERATRDLGRATTPNRPFVIVGQTSVADPTRSPPGTDTAWAYTHLPEGSRGEAVDAMARSIESEIERRAPGFRDAILGRHVFSPSGLEAFDANLVEGAVNGGTAALRQQLYLRPVPGGATAATPVRGLYLASASAHPGGGVHGACGARAARAALDDEPD